MDASNKENNLGNDEIDLSEYWEAIRTGRKLIIGLLLVSVSLTAMITFARPKMYKAEATLRTNVRELSIQQESIILQGATNDRVAITAKDIIDSIGNLNPDAIQMGSSHSVEVIKLMEVRGAQDKLAVVIEAKDVDSAKRGVEKVISYINNMSAIRDIAEINKQKVRIRLGHIDNLMKEYSAFINSYQKELAIKGFHSANYILIPPDLRQKVLALEYEKDALQKGLHRTSKIELISGPFISIDPVGKKLKMRMIIAAVISIIAGVFLAIILGRVKKRSNHI